MRTQFKLMIHQSEGQQFENLFSSIMQNYESGFKPVKAYGKQGDKGNDGWESTSGKYYQVFAPEDIFKSTNNAKNKIRDDFEKLIEYWSRISPIKEYYFVVNDKYKGVPPSLNKIIRELQIEYSLEKVGLLTAADLERYLFTLSDNQISSIIGFSDNGQDKNRVREFLNRLHIVFNELFESGSEAGYFFPTIVYETVTDFFHCSKDWEFSKTLSSNQEVREFQFAVKNALINMVNQVDSDPYYEHIGLSFKYKIPYEIKNRDSIINERRRTMGVYVNDLVRAYETLRNYSV